MYVNIPCVSAEAHNKTPSPDCVLSVPCWYTDSQRRAVLDAASIAGILSSTYIRNSCTYVFIYMLFTYMYNMNTYVRSMSSAARSSTPQPSAVFYEYSFTNVMYTSIYICMYVQHVYICMPHVQCSAVLYAASIAGTHTHTHTQAHCR